MNTESNYARKRRLTDFLQALENEIVIDVAAFALAGTDPKSVGYFPRPGKWLDLARDRNIVARWVWRGSAALWRFGAAALFHLFQMARGYCEVRRSVDEFARLASFDDFALILSSRAGEIIGPDSIDNAPKCWITMPWVPVSVWPPGVHRVSVFALLTPRDLWSALLDAVVATEALARRQRSAAWVLQTYTAYNWFAVRRALERLDGRFVMAEHFDRWAVLVDSVAARLECLRSRSGRERSELVLVQHGAMGSLSGAKTGSASRLRLKRRLRAVTSLYVYDAQSECAFKNDVLSRGCIARGISVNYFRPRIQLRPNPCGDSTRVLFVGHPFCEDLHVHVLETLKKSRDIKAFYKPHPMAQMNERMNRQDWVVIRDKSQFPEVDLLVSYPSTLVVEYAAWNVRAVVHPINLETGIAEEFVASATQEIDRIVPPRL